MKINTNFVNGPVLSIFMLVSALIACKESSDPPASNVEVEVTATPEPPKILSPFEKAIVKLHGAKTLEDAVSITKPFFSDTRDDTSPGAAIFGAWSADNMDWGELNKLSKTTRALVFKDPDAERGKRICVRGSIVEITVTQSGSIKVYIGGIVSGYTNITRFIAVRSTGELVASSNSHFCGVVIGKQSYANSGGGTTHAVFAVGMFDLPENKKAP